MKEKLFNVAKIVITVALIVYSLSRVNLAEVGDELITANFLLVLLALGFYLLAISINAVKWSVLLRAQEVNVPFPAVLQYMWVGFFFNNILPANIGGDVMRGYEMARYTDRTAQAAVSVVVDRIMGLIAYMSAAAVAAIAVVLLTSHPELRIFLWLAIVALAALAAALAVLISRRLRHLVGRLFELPILSSLAPIYESISNAFDAYRFRYRALVVAFLLALCGLMAANVVNWLLFQAIGADVSFLYVMLFNPLIALVLTIPISIGGHGIIQNAYPFFYGLVDTPEEQAVAASVLMSFIIIVGSLPGGVLWLRRRRTLGEEATVPAGQTSG